MLSTSISRILSEGKYGWQHHPSTKKFSLMVKFGLYLLMARTGTGKSNAIYYGLISDKKKEYGGSILYCSKELIQQHMAGLEKYLVENDHDLGSHTKNTNNENRFILSFDNFTILIKTFPAKNKTINEEFETYSSYGMHIDEFDFYQTQFGLNHLGGRYGYNKKSILNNHYNTFQKTKYNILIRLCKKRQIYGYSATLDETINSDLVPYESKININVLVVNHSKESLNDTDIVYSSDSEMYINLKRTKNKSIVYTSRIGDADNICNMLDYLGINYYRWDSRHGGPKIDMAKHNASLISVFVNSGARGINNTTVKDVYIFRPLSASTRENREMLSSLCNQMAGRIRNGGKVYWSREMTEATFYDLIEQLYKTFEDQDNIYRRNFFRKLNTKLYNISYIDNGVRLFIYNFIRDNKPPHCLTGPVLTKLNQYLESLEFKHAFRNISNHNLSPEFVEEYLKLEETLVSSFIETVKGMSDEEKHTLVSKIVPKRLRVKDSNSTGGGVSKPNISPAEREKGISYLITSIIRSELSGKSLFFKQDEDEDEELYSEKYMHAYWKKDLSSTERTKSRYAIPMLDVSDELGMNDKETTDKRVLEWKDGTGIVINYGNLKEFTRKRNWDYLRSDEDITRILLNYNKLQLNC